MSSARVARPDSAWDDLAGDIAFRLASADVDSVVLQIRSGDASRRHLLDLRLEYVGGMVKARPWLSVYVTGVALLEALSRAKVTWDGVLTSPWTLPVSPAGAAVSPSILIWRSLVRPIDYGRLAVEIARDTLAVTDLTRLKVRWTELDGPPRVLPTVTLTRGPLKGKVIGTCARCGRDLRDPSYARLGIGPECLKSSSAQQRELQLMANTAARSGKRLIPQAKQQSDWVNRVAEHWSLPRG